MRVQFPKFWQKYGEASTNVTVAAFINVTYASLKQDSSEVSGAGMQPPSPPLSRGTSGPLQSHRQVRFLVTGY